MTLSAAEDHDALAGTAVFEHDADGGDYDSISEELTATEGDNDTAALTLTPASVTVNEGTTANYTVKLATLPSASVTVEVAKKTTGDQDGDLSLTAGSKLTFTTSTWSTAQTVTLSAAEDHDAEAGTAVFTHTADGGDYGAVPGGSPAVSKELTATEGDNDTAGLVFDPSAGPSVPEGRDRDLHREAGDPAFRQGDRDGGEEDDRRPGRGPVVDRGFVPDLHDVYLEHGADGDPVRGRGPRRDRRHRGVRA